MGWISLESKWLALWVGTQVLLPDSEHRHLSPELVLELFDEDDHFFGLTKTSECMGRAVISLDPAITTLTDAPPSDSNRPSWRGIELLGLDVIHRASTSPCTQPHASSLNDSQLRLYNVVHRGCYFKYIMLVAHCSSCAVPGRSRPDPRRPADPEDRLRSDRVCRETEARASLMVDRLRVGL